MFIHLIKFRVGNRVPRGLKILPVLHPQTSSPHAKTFGQGLDLGSFLGEL